MVTQILNFGLPAPIDIQVIGHNIQGNREYIDRLLKDISYVPGTADLHIQQPFNNPHFVVAVDRSKAQDIGLTQRDVAGSLLARPAAAIRPHPLSGSIREMVSVTTSRRNRRNINCSLSWICKDPTNYQQRGHP